MAMAFIIEVYNHRTICEIMPHFSAIVFLHVYRVILAFRTISSRAGYYLCLLFRISPKVHCCLTILRELEGGIWNLIFPSEKN